MSGWQTILLALACFAVSLGGAYSKGKSAGRAQAVGEFRKIADELKKEAEAKEAAIEQIAINQLLADQQRQSTHQEIIRERTQIIDRPVYRNQCIDADGLRILDDIAANAHGKDPAASDDRPAAAAQNAAQP